MVLRLLELLVGVMGGIIAIGTDVQRLLGGGGTSVHQFLLVLALQSEQRSLWLLLLLLGVWLGLGSHLGGIKGLWRSWHRQRGCRQNSDFQFFFDSDFCKKKVQS